MSILVLIVEDDAILRKLATETLRGEGFRVLEACDTASAIALLDDNPGIEVLFTDIEMPGSNGFALAVMAVLLSPRLHVLYTSGRATLSDRRREHTIPAKMLAKPYRMDHLAGAIEDAYRCPPGHGRESGLPTAAN
jgi:DNA-binding NtrC family response regulator